MSFLTKFYEMSIVEVVFLRRASYFNCRHLFKALLEMF
jgi:hypothetical protein